jgi:cytochrome P450
MDANGQIDGSGQSPEAVAGEVLAGLFSSEGRADPYPLYGRLRAFGPAVTMSDGTMLVSGYTAMSALLRDHRLVKSPEGTLTASGYPDWESRPSLRLMFTSLLVLNPPAHTRLRRLVSGVFTARRVELLRPAVEKIVEDGLESLDGAPDFVDAFAYPLPVTVIGELLGVPASDRPMFQELARAWITVLEDLRPEVVERADRAAEEISAYLGALAAERARQPQDDLISAMVSALDGDKLSDEELVTMAALLLAGGFETTTGLLSNGLVALLSFPEQAARLRASGSADFAAVATEELLRFDSPVQLLFSRIAESELEAGGLRLAAGQRMITLLGAANRDPSVFSSPDSLILDRREQPPVSFGGGIHYCLGAPLARLEASVAFPSLLSRYPRLSLAGTPVARSGVGFRGHARLPIAVR